jgi:hypothetical protein
MIKKFVALSLVVLAGFSEVVARLPASEREVFLSDKDSRKLRDDSLILK